LDFSKTALVVFWGSFLTENLVFFRGFGIEEAADRQYGALHIGMMGLFCFCTVMPATYVSWVIKNMLGSFGLKKMLQPIIWLLILFAAHCLANYIFGKIKLFDAARQNLTVLDFLACSCASFAIILLTIENNISLLNTIIYSFGSLAGFIVSLFLIHAGRERMRFSNVGAAFDGLAILLIYTGILSMSIYCFISYKMPVV
jgi:electron transport complex protein RnfA